MCNHSAMKAFLILLGACLFLYSDANSGWTPEFSMQVRTIGSVVPSPDAKWVAYIETKPVAEGERSEQVSQIFLARADGSRRFQLTRNEKGSSAPAFSPDGRFVYFLSDRTGKSNLYRALIDGGEAEMLTDVKGPFGEFKVAPDGKAVAYTAYEPPADLEKARKEKRDFHVVDSDPESMALYLIPTEASDDGKRDAKKVFEAKYHIANFDWSPDGKSIAFEHWPSPLADDWTKAGIGEADVATGKVTELAKSPAAESAPRYSPDGRYLAFDKTSEPVRWPGDARIALMNRATGELRLLPDTFDARPTVLGWAADSKSLVFLEAKGTRSELSTMPVDGPPRSLYLPDRGVVGNSAQLNTTGTYLGFSYETASKAPEAYLLGVQGGQPVRVSRANDNLAEPALGETKVVRWKSKDGLEVEGLLTLPVGYEAGKRYPLTLNIHGGPAGAFAETFIGRFSIYPIAAFSSRGYAILRPNPRGSGGYGKQFRYANVADWGGKDYDDDMTGVDYLIAQGIADPDHMAVLGWSYGGFMTSWVITHTDRFKAAVVGAGVTNLWSFTGTSDIPGFLPDYFEGEPWNKFNNFAEHSPLTFVKNVKTPTLILHGEADVRVPTSQGYEFYHALKRQGVITKMVVYPRTPHGPREPKFILDIAQRNMDWVEKYAR
jgi:dipeptidyl aminopeptidase/acylaminoacyl peptidase